MTDNVSFPTRCVLHAMRHDWFRRLELQLLMNLTARAMGKPSPRIWPMPVHKALRRYAEFTRDNLSHTPGKQLLRRMNDEAYAMGHSLRRMLHLRRQADVEQLTIALYRNIGIAVEGNIPGRLCFRSCFFSRYYTPGICLAASALDDGIMRGLAGSGQLRFEQRITEGCPCCKATFDND